MNYLGHAYLSSPETFIGNMAGDSLKGVDVSALEDGLRDGVTRHRMIDAVTDAHPSFVSVTSMFAKGGLRYAGVLADLAFDWAIASEWTGYSGVEWDVFKDEIYARLDDGSRRMPGYFYVSAGWLVAENWFESYRSIAGMELAFYRLSRKTDRAIDLKKACGVIASHEGEIRECTRRLVSSLLQQPGIREDIPNLLSRPCFSP